MRETAGDGGKQGFLERDPVASLLVRMAADGVVDFSKADLLDRNWQIRLLWLGKSYQQQKQADLLKLYLLKMTNTLSSDEPKLIKEMWGHCDRTIDDISRLDQPWLDRDTKPKTQYNEYAELIAAYKRIFGDPKKTESENKSENS